MKRAWESLQRRFRASYIAIIRLFFIFETLFRLRAHVYVFKKIRFRKDPFWGVHTYRTSIRRPRSHGRGLILGNPPPENHCLCVRTRVELKSHFLCLFPLLASVVLLYCFTCLCPVEGVYVVCESWRQVIKERLKRQNETQTKDEAKWNKNKTPHLRLRRRRGRVASEDNSNHPPFCFRRQLLSKQKEMSCSLFRQRDCKCTRSNIHLIIASVWARHFWSPWKQWQKRSGYHVHTQKRSGSETSVFERPTFGSVFEKLRFGARAFSKSSGYVRIRVTVSMYPGSKSSVFEKTRVRVHVASHVALIFIQNYRFFYHGDQKISWWTRCRWRAVNFEIHLWSSGMNCMNADRIWRSISIEHVQIEAWTLTPEMIPFGPEVKCKALLSALAWNLLHTHSRCSASHFWAGENKSSPRSLRLALCSSSSSPVGCFQQPWTRSPFWFSSLLQRAFPWPTCTWVVSTSSSTPPTFGSAL